MTDLVPTGGAPCSNAFALNARGQAVGNATDCHGHALTAVLWDHGTAFDLNALVAPFAVHVTEPDYINDQGEIAATGVLPDGDQHLVLLVPAALAASEGLATLTHTQPAVPQSATTVNRAFPDPRDFLGPSRDRLAARYHFRLP